MTLVIAIDGPAGSGKSSIAKALAIQLGAQYLETGAIYRAVTYLVLKNKIDLADEPAIVHAVRNSHLRLGTDPHERHIYLADTDVSDQLRSADVTAHVSHISAIPQVREALLDIQRSSIEGNSIVVAEGRDMGTVVFPDAHIKFFLTASAEERAKRRAQQDNQANYQEILADINRRDAIDSSRKTAPLQVAPGSIVVDTTNNTFEQSVHEVEKICRDYIDHGPQGIDHSPQGIDHGSKDQR